MQQLTARTLFLLMLAATGAAAQPYASGVNIVGQMKDVMWKGQLGGKIQLDTLSNPEHLYGLGPVEYLSGEILLMDGIAYRSQVLSDTSMMVEEANGLRAPFFGYARVPTWTRQELPPDISTIGQLEAYLDQSTRTVSRPYFFRLRGRVDSATIHIVNLPPGTAVSSPDQAHQGMVHYPLRGEEVEILGFFSTEHQAILTHHDTFLHMHLITEDRRKMGHVDALNLQPGTVALYLPQMP